MPETAGETKVAGSAFPTWLVVGAVVLVIVALVLARSGVTSAAAVPVATLMPAASDPNAEATAQVGIAAKASAFGSLASLVSNISTTNAAAVASVDNTATQVSGQVAQAKISAGAATNAEAYATERDMIDTMAQTTQTGIVTAAQTAQTSITEAGATSRNYTNDQTTLSIAGVQSTLGMYLADVTAKISADTNRTALSQTESNNGVRRQANTDSAVTSTIGTVVGGILTVLALL